MVMGENVYIHDLRPNRGRLRMPQAQAQADWRVLLQPEQGCPAASTAETKWQMSLRRSKLKPMSCLCTPQRCGPQSSACS